MSEKTFKVYCPKCEQHIEAPVELYSEVVACPICNEQFKPSEEVIAGAFRQLKAETKRANQNVTHAEFVAGYRANTIGFNCLCVQPHQLIRGARKVIFNLLVASYHIAPLLLVPLWAYHRRDIWLLGGIPVSLIATRIAARLIYKPQAQHTIAGCLLVGVICSWIAEGIHSYETYFGLCALWGFWLFVIADEAEREYAAQSLMEYPDVFNEASAEGLIRVIRRGT